MTVRKYIDSHGGVWAVAWRGGKCRNPGIEAAARASKQACPGEVCVWASRLDGVEVQRLSGEGGTGGGDWAVGGPFITYGYYMCKQRGSGA